MLRWRFVILLLLIVPKPLRAQENCMLVPIPLTERLTRATWAVEAQIGAQQVIRDEQGHLLTRYGLTVFKVFRETAGASVPTTVLVAGGTLGNLREVVSSTPRLSAGQQGVFFLEPDPWHPGEWRLFAGPQGVVRYNLDDRTAADPFVAYPAIETDLYAALRNSSLAEGFRLVQPNPALAAPKPAQRPTATMAIMGFSPASIPAGTGSILTINGNGFGAVRGSSTVQFRNADNGGTSRVRPLDADYVSWSDTQIQVRVPDATLDGSPAGSGTVAVVDGSSGATTFSSASLTISYAVANYDFGSPVIPARIKLINANGTGGYTLAYAPSFQQATTTNQAARAAFERSVTQWACTTGANRITTTTSSTTVPTGSASDGTNTVTFDNATPTLPVGVLGITYSYFRICGTEVTLPETDFVFANRSDWNFGDHALAFSEYDFESVALHELGHGILLDHVINMAAVMHYSLTNGQSKRVLGTNDDLPGGRDEVAFSTTANTTACGAAPGAHQRLLLAGCYPLPVELTAFAARYTSGQGTTLTWATASEKNSAYFAIEVREAESWAELLRQPGAGTSSSTHRYTAADPRPLAGTRYYRLRQVDQDGTVAYSPVVAVAGQETGLALYPNPAETRLQLQVPAGSGRVVLYDAVGREVARFALLSGTDEVDVSKLPAGLYQAEWTDGTTVRRARLEKR